MAKKICFRIWPFFNIGLLFFYKYLDFVFETVESIFKTDSIHLGLILPLGISFFTFQQLSFLIDSYNGKVTTYNILDYSLFVTFFPQLIAGPIVLHHEIIPQFENPQNLKLNSHCLQNKQSVKFSINSAFFIEMCYNKCKKIIKSNKKACT